MLQRHHNANEIGRCVGLTGQPIETYALGTACRDIVSKEVLILSAIEERALHRKLSDVGQELSILRPIIENSTFAADDSQANVSYLKNVQSTLLLAERLQRETRVNISQNLPIEKVCDKVTYFKWLSHRGYFSGWQSFGGTCLVSSNLLSAGCLTLRANRDSLPVKNIYFIGDSLVREHYLSLVRHFEYLRDTQDTGLIMDTCQPFGVSSQLHTKHLKNNKYCYPSRDEICMQFISRSNGGLPEVPNFNESARVLIVASSSPIHTNVRNDFFGADFRTTYRVFFEQYVASLKHLLQKSPAGSHLFFLETPDLNFEVLDLHPRKDDIHKFHHFQYMKMMRHIEMKVLSELTAPTIATLPLNEVYRKYGFLTCDGMHFGSSFARREYGCHGFPVVNDILIQLLLGKVCAPVLAAAGISAADNVC